MPYLIRDGERLYYESSGSGKPLLLILGLGASIFRNKSLISALDKNFNVITLDNRDSGRSRVSDKNYLIEDLADDTKALMEKLKIEKANVIGISMGGKIALSLAIQYPEKINNLILVSAFSGSKKWMRLYLPLIMLKPLKKIHELKGKKPQSRLSAYRQLNATINFNADDQIKKLEMPVTIMHGKKDRKISIKNAVNMKSNIKGSKIIYFNGGHLFFIKEENESFIKQLTKILV